MSAYIVDHDHIDALLTFALCKSYGRGVVYTANETLIEIVSTNATEIGRILLTENERSVRHRYPDDAPGDLPGSIGEDAASYLFHRYERTPSPLVILKACECFDYQACETDDY
jgi:mannitol-1-phosphate/altronate dehydrogenase